MTLIGVRETWKNVLEPRAIQPQMRRFQVQLLMGAPDLIHNLQLLPATPGFGFSALCFSVRIDMA
jgi:hypothetical protein